MIILVAVYPGEPSPAGKHEGRGVGVGVGAGGGVPFLALVTVARIGHGESFQLFSCGSLVFPGVEEGERVRWKRRIRAGVTGLITLPSHSLFHNPTRIFCTCFCQDCGGLGVGLELVI